MAKICLYPSFNALYYSFYFPGLSSVFGQHAFRFSTHDFPRFHHHCLAFIVPGPSEKKIYISAGDGPGFNEAGLAWSDVYAKINIAPGSVPEPHAHKVVAIGPSFGIHTWPFPGAFRQALQTYRHARSVIERPREHFANYYRQAKYRLPLEVYAPEPSRDDYVYFAASLWKREPETNWARAAFAEACTANPEITFEGGFAPRLRNDIPGFEHLTLEKRYTLAEYIRKTKASAVVFNTPAVSACLGWKLGEFLALGKAIISLPLTREMPAPLAHGEHIHLVDGSPESIREAVEQLCRDRAYRQRLEHAARRYYLEYLQPACVIKQVLQAARRAQDLPVG